MDDLQRGQDLGRVVDRIDPRLIEAGTERVPRQADRIDRTHLERSGGERFVIRRVGGGGASEAVAQRHPFVLPFVGIRSCAAAQIHRRDLEGVPASGEGRGSCSDSVPRRVLADLIPVDPEGQTVVVGTGEGVDAAPLDLKLALDPVVGVGRRGVRSDEPLDVIREPGGGDVAPRPEVLMVGGGGLVVHHPREYVESREVVLIVDIDRRGGVRLKGQAAADTGEVAEVVGSGVGDGQRTVHAALGGGFGREDAVSLDDQVARALDGGLPEGLAAADINREGGVGFWEGPVEGSPRLEGRVQVFADAQVIGAEGGVRPVARGRDAGVVGVPPFDGATRHPDLWANRVAAPRGETVRPQPQRTAVHHEQFAADGVGLPVVELVADVDALGIEVTLIEPQLGVARIVTVADHVINHREIAAINHHLVNVSGVTTPTAQNHLVPRDKP